MDKPLAVTSSDFTDKTPRDTTDHTESQNIPTIRGDRTPLVRDIPQMPHAPDIMLTGCTICCAACCTIGTSAAGGAVIAALRNAIYPNTDPWNVGQAAVVGTLLGSMTLVCGLLSMACQQLVHKYAA